MKTEMLNSHTKHLKHEIRTCVTELSFTTLKKNEPQIVLLLLGALC